MNLRQVEVFRAIMQTGSVTGAARLLKVSQPNVSRLLRHTEDGLGFSLFVRHGGRLLPTPEAEALHGEAEAALQGMQRVADLASALGRRGEGTLRIAANPSFGVSLLPRVAATFRDRHPRTRLDILTTGHPAVVDRVALRQADLGLTQFSSTHPGLRSERLGSFACRIALPTGSPLAKLAEVPVKALAGTSMVSYEPDTPIGQAISRYLAENDVRVRAGITVRYPIIACMFVDVGLGAAIIDPFLALGDEARRRFAIRPLSPPLLFETWLMTRERRPLSHAGRPFVKVLAYTLHKFGNSAER